jgi:predicted nucleic acid-binding protein
MTVILDAGGISALAESRGRLIAFRARWDGPAQVPSVVLAEALTGDHRRDHSANRLLRSCEIHDVDESMAREGALLRTLTGRAGTISATDAVVAAFAARQKDPVVLTSDPRDLTALAEHAQQPMKIMAV